MPSSSPTPSETGINIELEAGAPVQVWPTVMWSAGSGTGLEHLVHVPRPPLAEGPVGGSTQQGAGSVVIEVRGPLSVHTTPRWESQRYYVALCYPPGCKAWGSPSSQALFPGKPVKTAFGSTSKGKETRDPQVSKDLLKPTSDNVTWLCLKSFPGSPERCPNFPTCLVGPPNPGPPDLLSCRPASPSPPALYKVLPKPSPCPLTWFLHLTLFSLLNSYSTFKTHIWRPLY